MHSPQSTNMPRFGWKYHCSEKSVPDALTHTRKRPPLYREKNENNLAQWNEGNNIEQTWANSCRQSFKLTESVTLHWLEFIYCDLLFNFRSERTKRRTFGEAKWLRRPRLCFDALAVAYQPQQKYPVAIVIDGINEIGHGEDWIDDRHWSDEEARA